MPTRPAGRNDRGGLRGGPETSKKAERRPGAGAPPASLTIPARLPLARRVALLAAACLALPAAASAAPVISGEDDHWWNAASPTPTYVISSPAGLTFQWRLRDGDWSSAQRGLAVAVLPDLPDGTYVLEAREVGAGARGSSARIVRVDRVPPQVSLSSPPDGAEYAVGQVVAADFACEAGASCLGTVAPGEALDTSAPGERVFEVVSADRAGNVTRVIHRFGVRAVAVPDPPPDPPVPLPAPPDPPPPAPPAPPPPAPPTPAPGPPAGVSAGVASPAPPPVAAPPRPAALPRLNARRMLPRAGARVPAARALLRWPALRRARLYNVQIFRVEGARAVKVASLFPRTNRVRLPARRLRPGAVHVWRVWPMVGTRFTKRPIGVSHFVARGAPPRR